MKKSLIVLNLIKYAIDMIAFIEDREGSEKLVHELT